MNTKEILSHLGSGGLTAFNTDTVPGIFAAYNDRAAADKITALKKSARGRTYQVFICDLGQLDLLGIKSGKEEIRKFLPGKFSVLLETKLRMPHIVKDGKISIRMMSSGLLKKVLNERGPLLATSFNESGKAFPRNYGKFSKEIMICEDLKVISRSPSTLIDIKKYGYDILRPGSGDIGATGAMTVIGSDHAGLEMKSEVKETLHKYSIIVTDVGTFNGDSVDYPDIAHIVGKAVQKKKFPYGILICGTGIGMSIAVNRFKGVRGALCHNENFARLARMHNDANVLVLSGRFLDKKILDPLISTFFFTSFEAGRHAARIKKIEKV